MNRVLTLSLDGEFTFRLHITKDGKLARLEIKKFNDKDDKYKDAKTEYLGKVIRMEDLEKVLRESKEFDELRPMSAEEFTDWLKSEYKKIFGDRYDDNVATESASKLIASNDDNIENAKREAESMIARMRRQDEEREMFDNLTTIKTLLCDAPADVKASFNEVVNHFDSKFRNIDPAKVRHGHSILEKYESKGAQYDPIKVLMKEIPGCSKEVAEYIVSSF